MAKIAASMFPTKFAISLARNCELYSEQNPKRMPETNKDYLFATNCHLALAEFQQFSLIAEFDDAMVAYIDFDKLSKVQLLSLEKIYKHTRVWIKGQVVENLLENIDVEAKSASAIAEQIMNITGNKLTEEPADKDVGTLGLNITLNK